MFKNLVKVAFRNLWKNKSYSIINISGLTFALAGALLIFMYVINQLAFDKFNVNANRIYRIDADFKVRGSIYNDLNAPAPMAATMLRNYPTIENAVRIKPSGEVIIKANEKSFIEKGCFYADSTLFDVFSITMIYGDPQSALKQPFSVVIDETLAKKYFNKNDVIGSTLEIGNEGFYKITGVIRDMPAESHLHLHIIKSMSTLAASRGAEWLSVDFMTYLLTKPGVSEEELDGYLRETTKKYAEPGLESFLHTSISQLEQNGDHFKFSAIPLTKIHLYSPLSNELEPSGNIQFIRIFTVIAVFILLIAYINFINLSTAGSAERSKEVGVRKVLGSTRVELIFQFLIESVVVSFLALFLAIGLSLLLYPYFENLTVSNVPYSLFSIPWFFPTVLLMTILLGILGGVYPAIFISRFNTISVLNGNINSLFTVSWLRNTLIFFQFTAVIILIIGTLVVNGQLNFINNKNLGYDRSGLLVLQNTNRLGFSAQSFKQEVLKLSGVKSGTLSHFLPITLVNGDQSLYTKNGTVGEQYTAMASWTVDADYIPTLKMHMASGRNFSSEIPIDSNSIILNEAAVKSLGYLDALNQNIYLMGGHNNKPFKIIGVVKDFNYGSMHNKIDPLVLKLGNDSTGMAFRINTQNMTLLISKIERLFHTFGANMGEMPFSYSFMDDDFDHLYRSDKNTGELYFAFSLFAILIACSGLFGLVTYSAERRSKEICIRRVLGASVLNILTMLGIDFLKIIGISIIVAFTVAWWIMNNWLENFAYRINLSWPPFVLSAVISLLIAIATICFRLSVITKVNPARSSKNKFIVQS